jgi:hypothetical protein
MNKLLSKIRQIENTLNLSEHRVEVIKFVCESKEDALIRHLKSHPQDAEKEHIFIVNYGTKDHFLGTYEEMVDFFQKEIKGEAARESEEGLPEEA